MRVMLAVMSAWLVGSGIHAAQLQDPETALFCLAVGWIIMIFAMAEAYREDEEEEKKKDKKDLKP